MCLCGFVGAEGGGDFYSVLHFPAIWKVPNGVSLSDEYDDEEEDINEDDNNEAKITMTKITIMKTNTAKATTTKTKAYSLIRNKFLFIL